MERVSHMGHLGKISTLILPSRRRVFSLPVTPENRAKSINVRSPFYI